MILKTKTACGDDDDSPSNTGLCSDFYVLKWVPTTRAAKQFHLSRPRYYQLRAAFEQQGALGLVLETRGPKTDYRRTQQIVRLVIRHRFLDAEASAQVIAQKLRQLGHPISQRSVERIIADYGLQKKTLRP